MADLYILGAAVIAACPAFATPLTADATPLATDAAPVSSASAPKPSPDFFTPSTTVLAAASILRNLLASNAARA